MGLVVSERPPSRQGFNPRCVLHRALQRRFSGMRILCNCLLRLLLCSLHFLSPSVRLYSPIWGQIKTIMSCHNFNLIVMVRGGHCVIVSVGRLLEISRCRRQDHPGQDRSAMSESNPHFFRSFAIIFPHLPCSLFFSDIPILLLVAMSSPHLISCLLIMDPACDHFAH